MNKRFERNLMILSFLSFLTILLSYPIFAVEFVPVEKYLSLEGEERYQDIRNRLDIRQWREGGQKFLQSQKEHRNILAILETESSPLAAGLRQLIAVDLLVMERNLDDLERELPKLKRQGDALKDSYFEKKYHLYRGIIFKERGDIEKAIESFHQVIPDKTIGEDDMDISLHLYHLTQAYVQQGSYQKAVATMERNLTIVRRLGLKDQELQIMYNLGSKLGSKGEIASAFDYLFKTLEIAKSYQMGHWIAASLNDIAVEKMSMGEKEEALKYYLEIETFFHLPDVSEILKATILSNILSIYSKIQKMEQAEIYYSRLMEVVEKNDFKIIRLRGRTLYAIFMVRVNKPEEAIKILQSLENIESEEWPVFDRLQVFSAFFFAYSTLEQYPMAETYYKKAVKLLPELGRDNVAMRIYELGYELFGKMDRPAEKFEYYQKYSDLRLKTEQEKSKKLLYARENKYVSSQNKLLEQENALQAEELKSAQYLKFLLAVSILAAVILLFSFFSIHIKNQRISTQKRKIEDILENIELGILTIKQDGKIGSELSPKSLDLLKCDKKELVGQSFGKILDVLKLNHEQSSQMRDILETCLGSDVLNFEMNYHFLNGEFPTVDNRILKIDWHPIEKEGKVVKILSVIDDITKTKSLEQEVHKKTIDNEISIELASTIFTQGKNLERIIKEAQLFMQSLNKEKLQIQAKDILMDLHTLKGNARIAELRLLSNAIHELESMVHRVKEMDDEADLIKASENVNNILSLYHNVYNKFSNRHITDLDPGQKISIGVGHIVDNVQKLLNQESIELKSFSLTSPYLDWDEELFLDVIDIVSHALTNSVDHGYILAKKSGRKIENDPEFNIEVTLEGDYILVSIKDNGVGLDEDSVKRLAASRNFKPKAKEDIYDVLFEGGVSTARDVSLTSGRVVGLSAIQRIAEKRQGHARIRPRSSGGTIVSVSIPIDSKQDMAL